MGAINEIKEQPKPREDESSIMTKAEMTKLLKDLCEYIKKDVEYKSMQS